MLRVRTHVARNSIGWRLKWLHSVLREFSISLFYKKWGQFLSKIPVLVTLRLNGHVQPNCALVINNSDARIERTIMHKARRMHLRLHRISLSRSIEMQHDGSSWKVVVSIDYKTIYVNEWGSIEKKKKEHLSNNALNTTGIVNHRWKLNNCGREKSVSKALDIKNLPLTIKITLANVSSSSSFAESERKGRCERFLSWSGRIDAIIADSSTREAPLVFIVQQVTWFDYASNEGSM